MHLWATTTIATTTNGGGAIAPPPTTVSITAATSVLSSATANSTVTGSTAPGSINLHVGLCRLLVSLRQRVPWQMRGYGSSTIGVAAAHQRWMGRSECSRAAQEITQAIQWNDHVREAKGVGDELPPRSGEPR